MSRTHTYTFALLEVSAGAYDEIAGKLREAKYDHAFVDAAIDMHGIGLTRAPEANPFPPPDRLSKSASIAKPSQVPRSVELAMRRGGWATYRAMWREAWHGDEPSQAALAFGHFIVAMGIGCGMLLLRVLVLRVFR